MKNNLLSLGQFPKKGYSMSLQQNSIKVYVVNRKLILKLPLSKNKTFKIGIQVLEKEHFDATLKAVHWLWHYMFGHLNFISSNRLQSKKMVQGLPQIMEPHNRYVKIVM